MSDSCKGCTEAAKHEPLVPTLRSMLPEAPWDKLAIEFNSRADDTVEKAALREKTQGKRPKHKSTKSEETRKIACDKCWR